MPDVRRWPLMYLGVRYPGDVIGSVLVSGAAIVLLTGLWNSFLEALLGRLDAETLARRMPGPGGGLGVVDRGASG
jgi:membrane-associated phospholipid phosphatase